MYDQHQTIRKHSAIIAGFSLFIMTIAAAFSYGFVHSSLIISGNSMILLKNIQEFNSLFNMEILGWLVIIITDLLVSWSFYVFLKPESTTLFELDIMASQVMLSVTSFENIWSFGLILFGLHLLVIGFVAWKAKQIPKIISILLAAAGFSYTLIHLMYSFIPQLDHVTS